jgi:hypothetical protein
MFLVKGEKMLTNFKTVLIDETEYWKEDIAKKAKHIWKVYFYDASEVTNCCELIPSYWLEPITCIWDAEDLDDETIDTIISEDLQDCDGNYFHCNYIDKLPNNIDLSERNFELDGLTEEEIREKTREVYEYVRGNT